MRRSTVDVSAADRAFDKDQEKEPGAHVRTYAPRNRLRRLFHAASWQCSDCGGHGVCTCGGVA